MIYQVYPPQNLHSTVRIDRHSHIACYISDYSHCRNTRLPLESSPAESIESRQQQLHLPACL
jgi:hypothetical protein